MHSSDKLSLACAMALAVVPAGAQAEPGNSTSITGLIRAEVVSPTRIEKLEDLRFGRFAQPSTAARITIAPGGGTSATGDIATSMNMDQGPAGRGAATFLINGNANRHFIGFISNRVTISNGTSTMRVRNLRTNLSPNRGRLDRNGEFILEIGGTLRVNANQEPGQYSGDFDVTVLYL